MGREMRIVIKWRRELAQVKPVDRENLESPGPRGSKVKWEKAGPTRTWGWYRRIERTVLEKCCPSSYFSLWHFPVAEQIEAMDRRMCGRMQREPTAKSLVG